jgi:hypothetical protein
MPQEGVHATRDIGPALRATHAQSYKASEGVCKSSQGAVKTQRKLSYAMAATMQGFLSVRLSRIGSSRQPAQQQAQAGVEALAKAGAVKRHHRQPRGVRQWLQDVAPGEGAAPKAVDEQDGSLPRLERPLLASQPGKQAPVRCLR